MNCFNVRELQSLLRNRFYMELTPTSLITKDSTTATFLKNKLNLFTDKNQLEGHRGIASVNFNPEKLPQDLTKTSLSSNFFW